MILDKLDNAERYFGLNPHFEEAFAYLRKTRLEGLPTGRNPIDGERLYVMLNRGEGRGRSGVVLECHRRYIDIQLTLSGMDDIGWKPVGECRQVKLAFDEAGDGGLFADAPLAWVNVPPGYFAIFFPDDGHAPMGGEGDMVKAVVKVAVG